MHNYIKIEQNISKLPPNGLQIVPEWSPNGLKTASKLVLEAFQSPNLIWDQFQTVFYLNLDSQGTQKAYKINDLLLLKMYIRNSMFLQQFQLRFWCEFKVCSNDFHCDSDPRLKMLMFSITAYLQWNLMFLIVRQTQKNQKKKTVLKTDRIKILFLIRFCM